MSNYIIFENFANDEEAWSRVHNQSTGYSSRKFTVKEIEEDPEVWEAEIRAAQRHGERHE